MKQIVSRILLSALLVLGGLLIYFGLDFVIVDDSESQTRINFHDFYEAEQVDTLFIGSSHVIYGINAPRLSQATGRNVYSLASSAQDYIDTYYTLKDALRSQEIKEVYFELSQIRMLTDSTEGTRAYIISDYLKSPAIRGGFLLSQLKPESYIQGFSRLRRNLDPLALPTAEDIRSVFAVKTSEDYSNFVGADNYLGHGSWKSLKHIGFDGKVAINYKDTTLNDFSVSEILPGAIAYVQRIIDLCREEGVSLTIYIAPYHEFYLRNFREYDGVIAIARKLAEDNGVPFIDLNLVKDEYLKLENPDFSNMDHINFHGGEKLADFLIRYMADPDGDYFCSSLAQKHPVSEGVLFAGYDRYYLNAKGKERHNKPYDEDCRVRLVFSAISDQETPIDARLWIAEQADDGQWILGKEIAAEAVDACHVQFIFPYDPEGSWYVQLLEPGTGEVLYETGGTFRKITV